MNKRDLKKFENILLEERARILRSIRNIEEESKNESGRDASPDLASYAEVGTDAFELETALNIASHEADVIQEIDDALERIKNGTYGICEGSGKEIPKKRLEAFPAARYTVDYQEQIEREQRQQGFNRY